MAMQDADSGGMGYRRMTKRSGEWQGDFNDGSCKQTGDPELTRAAWAVVEVDQEGQLVACLEGPVWRGAPQTAQAAEYVACASAIQIIDDDAELYGDCLNVVRDAMKSDSERLYK